MYTNLPLYTDTNQPARHGRLHQALLGTAAAAAVATFGAAHAKAAVQPFDEFLQSITATPAAAIAAKPGAAVESDTALVEMRAHLLKLYEGVNVQHSFEAEAQVFDCVPIAQQPSVRLLGLSEVAADPPGSPSASWTGDLLQPNDDATKAAAEGEHCEPGTIPMRRVTLDEVAHFKTLRKFLQKGPHGAGQAPTLAQGAHGYAHAYQNVANFGGFGALNLWDPNVVTSAPYDEIFSLSQHWYVGYTPTTQTAEVGWQNFPAKYGTRNSVLFTYWTADAYQHTGCYNLDCPGFVQTDFNIRLGGTFSSYSQSGGAQSEVSVGYYLYQGNWWLAVGNTWVGYYPTSLYAGGQMSRNATEIDFGGETAPGGSYWSAMGSGQFAAAGFERAAYQRQIIYRDSGNGAHTPSLTLSQPSPNCFTGTKPAIGGSGWGTYFFFGGPGGMLGTC